MKTLFQAVLAVCALSMASDVSAGVIVGDKEWRQVTETVDFSWNDFSSVCSTSDGSCLGSLTNGTVGTVSFDGWTWASQGDVAALFQGLPNWNGPLTAEFTHIELNSSWAPSFFDNLGFLPTALKYDRRLVSGLTRTFYVPQSFSPNAVQGTLIDMYDPATYLDWATTIDSVPSDLTDSELGGFFYRSASPTPGVPAPPTLALLLVPASLMVAVRRKRLSH